MRNIVLALALLVPTAVLAQSGHTATINVTATAPGTATVLRADGLCPTSGIPLTGTTLTSTLAIPSAGTAVSYVDKTITATSCYWVSLSATGGGSAVSNTFQGTVIGVSITVVVQ